MGLSSATLEVIRCTGERKVQNYWVRKGLLTNEDWIEGSIHC